VSSHRKGSPTTRSGPLRAVWCLVVAVAVATAVATTLTRTDGVVLVSLLLLAAYLTGSLALHRGAHPRCRGAHRMVRPTTVTYGEAVAGR
jgi:hypothetical protein